MAKGRDLQAQEIQALLQELGDELMTRGFTSVRVVMVGGAYMALIAQSRHTTQDIDIFPLNYVNSAHPDKTTRAVQAAISAVARRQGLRRDWFNDHVSGVMGEWQPATEQLRHWQTYGALEIYLPPDEYMFMSKVYGYRDKDYNDVQTLIARLNITTREQAQAIMDSYLSRKAQDECFVSDALDIFFDDEEEEEEE